MSELRTRASARDGSIPPSSPAVVRLSTTIVKSMALTHPDALEVRPNGVVGDRRFLVTRPNGARLSGSQKAPLLGIAVVERAGVLAFTWPDGTAIEARPEPQDPPVEVRLFDRSVLARRVRHPAVEQRLAREVGEPLVLAEVLDEHAGGHHPLSLISLATVADVAYRGGSRRLDARRFRPTIELDGCDPYEEDSWVGRVLRIGAVVVRVAARIPRCVLTTLDPDDGHPDFPTLEVLAGYRRTGTELPLGVYADVERAGVIRIGDRVEALPGEPTVTPR